MHNRYGSIGSTVTDSGDADRAVERCGEWEPDPAEAILRFNNKIPVSRKISDLERTVKFWTREVTRLQDEVKKFRGSKSKGARDLRQELAHAHREVAERSAKVKELQQNNRRRAPVGAC